MVREVRRVLAQAKKTQLMLSLGRRWRDSNGRLAGRIYPNYQAYVAHQRVKLDAARERFLRGHDQRFYTALRERLRALPYSFERRSVLCLGARQGTEVRVLIDEGAFAIGIDLNPGKENRHVVIGDFHDVQFATGSVDVVYTNSLDHAFDLDRVLEETRRVLAADGFFIAEVGRGTEEGGGPGFYESLAWASVDDMAARIEARGFRLAHRSDFTATWKGEQLVFHKAEIGEGRMG